MSRFMPSAFDFDVITDDTGSRGPRQRRVDPPSLEPTGKADPGLESPETEPSGDAMGAAG